MAQVILGAAGVAHPTALPGFGAFLGSTGGGGPTNTQVPLIATGVDVAGAGTDADNGVYTARGISGPPFPYYNLVGQSDNSAHSAIASVEGRWTIFNASGSPDYLALDTPQFPYDGTGWAAASGDAPAPTVTQRAPTVGEVLLGLDATWSVTPEFIESQWFWEDGTPISGAVNLTYTPVIGDAGHQLKLRQTPTFSGVPGASVFSALTAPVAGEGGNFAGNENNFAGSESQFAGAT